MRLIAAGVLALLVGGAPAWAGFSVAYDQRLTHQGQVTHTRVLVSGDRFRMESDMQGMTTIMIRNPQGVFSYIPDTGMGMKLPNVDTSQEPVPGDYQSYLAARNARKLREETVDGKVCDVYEFTDPKGKLTTAWVWREKQFPVKFVMPGMVAELSNIRFNPPVPPGAFDLPANVQMIDMGDMDFMNMIGQ